MRKLFETSGYFCMIRALSFLLIFFLSFSFVACKKKGQAKWMYYDETQCADKWEYTNNNERLKDNVMTYLDSQGITVYEMEIFQRGDAESCLACTCKTGRQFKLKVKKSDVEEAKGQGLYE